MTVTLSAPHDFTADDLSLVLTDKRVLALDSETVITMGIVEASPGSTDAVPHIRLGEVSGDTITWVDLVASSPGVSGCSIAALDRIDNSTFLLVGNDYETNVGPIVQTYEVIGSALSGTGSSGYLRYGTPPFYSDNAYTIRVVTDTTSTQFIVLGLADGEVISICPFKDDSLHGGDDHWDLLCTRWVYDDVNGWWDEMSTTIIATHVDTNIWSDFRFVKFNASNFAVAYNESGTRKVVHIDELATVGTVFPFPDDPGEYDIHALDTTDAFILAYRDKADSKGYAVYHQIGFNSLNTGIQVQLLNAATEDRVNVVGFTSTNIVAIFRNSADGGDAYAVEASLSGSVITVGDETDLGIQGNAGGSFSDIDTLGNSTFVYAQRQVTTGFGTAYVGEITAVEVKVLGVSALGGTIATTLWRPDELVVQLHTYAGGTLTFSDEAILGSCTEAQLDAGTYTAHPLYGPGGRLYIFGRMQDPQSLGDPAHVISFFGSAWAATETGWGTDVCGALIVENDGRLIAIRNISGANAKIYRGTNSALELRGTLTLPGVNPRAIDTNPFTSDVYLGADDGQSTMVIKVNPPFAFADISDLTFDHDATDPITSVVFL